MMKNLIYVFGFLMCFIPNAQVFVPYKIGDKFGLSYENGKILLQPQFDLIEIPNEKFFVGINTGNSEKPLKSFILKDKIILKQTNYDFFNEEGQYITVTQILDKEMYNYPRNTDCQEQDLYTLNGTKLISKSVSSASPIDKAEKETEFSRQKFSLFPIFAQRDYGKKGFHLLQLFDEEGNYICYASST